MQSLWGYSDFLSLLSCRPKMSDGLVVDTNILISATYDSYVFDITAYIFYCSNLLLCATLYVCLIL